MQFSILAASVAALAGAANAAFANTTVAGVVTSTEIVTALTTYCPEPTTLTIGSSTIVVTEATTLTITDCPCTITHTKTSSASTIAPTTTSSVPPQFTNAGSKPAVGAGAFAGVLAVAAYLL